MDDLLLAAHNTTQQSSTASTTSDSGQSTSSWWGWGSSILEKTVDAVKQQSETLVAIYKEDLQEFTKTIQDDTREVMKKLPKETTQTTEKLTIGVAEFLGLSGKKHDSSSMQGVVADRKQSRLLNLQSDLSTFCTDPSDMEEFETWRNQFKLSSRTEEISTLLSSNDKVREIHTKVVPVAVSYKDFWERYFYKLHKLNQEEERRAALVKRATSLGAEEEILWDDDADTDTTASTTPSLQPEKKEVEQFLEKLDDDTPQTEDQQPLEKAASPKQPETKEGNPPRVRPTNSNDEMEDDWENWE